MPVSPFALCIIAIVALGALGLPIGHSMIVASVFYILLSGLDLGTAAEQILNGLYNSYLLIAGAVYATIYVLRSSPAVLVMGLLVSFFAVVLELLFGLSVSKKS